MIIGLILLATVIGTEMSDNTCRRMEDSVPITYYHRTFYTNEEADAFAKETNGQRGHNYADKEETVIYRADHGKMPKGQYDCYLGMSES